MTPLERRQPETGAPGCDVEEDEQALFDADVLGDVISPVAVLNKPVGEANKGELVHLAEGLKALGNPIEHATRSICTWSTRNRHIKIFLSCRCSARGEVVVMGRQGGQATRVYIRDGLQPPKQKTTNAVRFPSRFL